MGLVALALSARGGVEYVVSGATTAPTGRTDDMTQQTIRQNHCQSCGSTSEENIGWDAMRRGDGYTACCNERVVEAPVEYSYNWRTGRDVATPTTCAARGDCSHD